METKIKPQTETERLFADLDKPSLHALSYALRHPDTWPDGFYWQFDQCDQCAMGLAHALWKKIPKAHRHSGASIMAKAFAMPYSDADNIFMGHGEWAPRRIKTKTVRTGFLGLHLARETRQTLDFRAVTPEMVADQIDAYLKNRK